MRRKNVGLQLQCFGWIMKTVAGGVTYVYAGLRIVSRKNKSQHQNSTSPCRQHVHETKYIEAAD